MNFPRIDPEEAAEICAEERAKRPKLFRCGSRFRDPCGGTDCADCYGEDAALAAMKDTDDETEESEP